MRKNLFGLSVLFSLVLLAGVGCHNKQGPLLENAQGTPDQACARNLELIAQGKRAWAESNNKGPDDTPTEADLMSFVRHMPTCPAGGTYTLGKVGEPPTCSIPAHNEAYKKKLA